jgi:tryptophan-rich sensory protein
MKKIVKFLVSVLVCELAGVLSSFFTTPAIPNWYAGLQKSFLSPPNWLFAPVWTTLFFLMGISLYLIWEKIKEDKRVKSVIYVFTIQLTLNILWSVAFFGLRSPLYGFIVIILLWFAILFTILKFYPISKEAAYLLLPYIIWVSFASILNFSIMILN